jgi:hypothetical protein
VAGCKFEEGRYNDITFLTVIFLVCLPECYIIQRVIIQNSVSGSFFSSYIKNPIPRFVKLFFC